MTLYRLIVQLIIASMWSVGVAGAATLSTSEIKKIQKTEFQSAYSRAIVGDPHAQYLLGRFYLQGTEIAKDAKIAASWLRRAAYQGHSASQVELGLLYIAGYGVEYSIERARYWWLQAAIAGNDHGEKELVELTLRINESAEGEQAMQGIYYELYRKRIKEAEDISAILRQSTPTKRSTPDKSVSKPVKATESVKVTKPIRTTIVKPIVKETVKPLAQTLDKSTTAAAAKATVQVSTGFQSGDQPQVAVANVDLSKDAQNTTAASATSTPAAVKAIREKAYLVRGEQLKALPNQESETVDILPKNLPVLVVGKKNGWSKVLVPNGFPVWVASEYVSTAGRILGDGINIRWLPNTKYPRLAMGQLFKGDEVKVVNQEEIWTRIMTDGLFPAWLRTEAVKTIKDDDATWDQRWAAEANRSSRLAGL